MPSQMLWNAHPRVFLPIEKTGEALCPYCGTLYMLQGRRPRGAALRDFLRIEHKGTASASMVRRAVSECSVRVDR